MVAVAKAHRFASRRSLRLRDLRDEPFAFYPRTTGAGLSHPAKQAALEGRAAR
ncbi:hypothetical protein [Aquincola agrisoli]|uniref:hypothetical protein n=1 Tax=Aquincola TaxID=391952 RepID=UPI00360F8843